MDPLLLTYISFTLIFTATPGATTALVVRNTLKGDRGAGLATAVGAAAANAAYAVVTAVGIGALLTRAPYVFIAIRFAGAAYLAWLGLQSLWRAARHADGGLRLSNEHGAGRPTRDRLISFREGLTFNLLNPSIAGFYFAVVPSFLPAHAGIGRLAIMGAAQVCLAFMCHATWACALNAVRRIFHEPWRRRALEAGTGAALLALATRMLGKG